MTNEVDPIIERIADKAFSECMSQKDSVLIDSSYFGLQKKYYLNKPFLERCSEKFAINSKIDSSVMKQVGSYNINSDMSYKQLNAILEKELWKVFEKK